MKVFHLGIILVGICGVLGSVVHTKKTTSHNVPANNTSNDTSNHTSNDSTHHDDHESHGIHLASLRYDYVAQPLLISVFLFAAGISKLGFHHADFLSSRVPESCLLIILGIIVGAILRFTIHDMKLMPGMNSELFFLYLLPPIILEAAWSLHDRTFFDNIGTVLVYAVIGTVLNCFLIGPTLFGLSISGAMGSINVRLIDCLVFSAIIVAVDPVAVLAIFQEIGVNNVLYFLVFGESLLNDAVTVVLYNMMITFSGMTTVPALQIFLGFLQFFVVSFGGIAIGVIFGMLTAIITKFTEHVRVIEPLSVFVLAYMAYLVAELFHFSGIISIIACGLAQAQYAFHNISQKSRTTIKYFSKMQSSISDCVIFVFLGIALCKDGMFKHDNWHLGFILWTLALCLFYRFFVVFLLTCFVNKSNRVRRIGKEEQFIMAYGGLRGAVAFSLVDLLEGNGDLPKAMFTTTLMVLIFFTVFVQGISIKPLVKFLRVKLESTDKVTIGEEINSHVTDHVMAGIEEVLGRRGEHHFREILEFYNSKYLKHWLQKNPTSTDEHIMSLYEKIALQQHFEGLAGSKMIQEKYVSDENLPLLIPDEVRNQIIEEETEPEDEDEESDNDLVLPPITIAAPGSYSPTPAPIPVDMGSTPITSPMHSSTELNMLHPEMLDDWLDKKIAEEREEDRKTFEKAGRKKSLFPQFRRKEHPRDMEPTAKDVRRLMAPSRRDVVHRKLDKNLKNDSSADLLKFLQEKQMRTRRMSRAVLGGGTSTPVGSQTNIHHSPRRSSVAASNMAASNYRRRLSLAVPERPKFQRDRSPSDFTGMKPDMNYFRGVGDALKNGEERKTSLRKKRNPFKKALTLNFEPEVTQLVNHKSPSRSPRPFDAIQEHGEGEEDTDEHDTSRSSAASTDSAEKRRRFRFKKSRSMSGSGDKHDQITRADTDPSCEKSSKVKFDLKSEIKPKSHKKKSMHQTKALDHSISSGENTDETGSPSSKSDFRPGTSSSPVIDPKSIMFGLDDTGSYQNEQDDPAKLLISQDHNLRKSSYTEAMSHAVPEGGKIEVLENLTKKDKSMKKQKSL